jgi:hypothetical protein
MAATWAGNKADCVVEDAAVTVSAVKTVSDGNLEVAGFFVLMVDGVPTSIVDAESDEVIATIDSIEDWSEDISVVGCSAEDDLSGSEDAGRRILESIKARRLSPSDDDETRKARNYLNSLYDSQFASSASDERDLSFTSFQAWLSDTNWCGSGTDTANTVCPSSSASGDLTADRACRRHDHGAKSNGIIGGYAVRLGCDIDHGLASATSNWCAQGIFGSWGLAQTWGCYDHGSYNCWNWKSKWWGGYWRYGSHCSGEHNHYGPWRYSSYSHRYGYRAKDKDCAGDIW